MDFIQISYRYGLHTYSEPQTEITFVFHGSYVSLSTVCIFAAVHYTLHIFLSFGGFIVMCCSVSQDDVISSLITVSSLKLDNNVI